MFISHVAVGFGTKKFAPEVKLGTLFFLFIGNILSRAPVEGAAMAIGDFTQWLVIPWAYWIDRHRQTQ